MSQTKILLFDFGAADGCNRPLSGILHSSGCVAELREERIAASPGARSDAELLESLAGFRPDIIFYSLTRDALQRAVTFFPLVRTRAPGVPAVVVIEGCAPEELLGLLRLGFDEFITPPLNPPDIITRLGWLLDGSRRAEPVTQALKEKLGLKQFVGESRVLIEEIGKIPLVAKCDANVMILGETGTGKELCARAVHYLSPRAHGPFITVNCGAIPVELVENELFGHERGAYTGATCAEEGLVQGSDGGTLFLDEVDCLPPAAQVKLLRFLQEKEFRALGSAKTRKVNVRVIAATNAVLEEAVREGRLRQDLYYRLNVIPLLLPPLRERREDIALLARHFLAKYAAEFEREPKEFSPEALRALSLYDWPGNVRELQHIVERAVVLCERRIVGIDDISLPGFAAAVPSESFKDLKAKVVAQFEKSYLLNTLRACDWNVTRAAQLACKNRRAFWQLLRKHGIDVRTLKFDS
ncbi:MAG TPA: sigma-54 dependent transcriptional regulator [Pyrinomonadaceae bacterium]|nr:sigma-54 dependent transcriptional regulator [Pyrinomonadaceae bacterium]